MIVDWQGKFSWLNQLFFLNIWAGMALFLTFLHPRYISFGVWFFGGNFCLAYFISNIHLSFVSNDWGFWEYFLHQGILGHCSPVFVCSTTSIPIFTSRILSSRSPTFRLLEYMSSAFRLLSSLSSISRLLSYLFYNL